MKTHKRLFLLLIPLVLLLPLLLASATYASPPTPAAGSFTITSSVVTDFKVVDDRVIVRVTNTVEKTGTFTGSMVCDARLEGSLSTGEGTFQSICPFTGTVDGAAGTVVIHIVGQFSGLGAIAEGHWVLQSGTGDLSNLHGQGTFSQTGLTGTYSGDIHFDPT